MRKLLFLLFAAGLIAAPVAALPALSLHAPTLAASHPAAPQVPSLPDLAPGVVSLGMAIKVKDLSATTNKFVQRAQGAQGDYTTGVQGAGADWQANTIAAESTYEAGVQEAIGKKRFGKGVQAAGAQKYTDNATKLGPQRYAQGVAQASGAYQKGMQPVLQTLAGISLPPRGVKGTNSARADIVAKTLRAMKVGS